MKAQRMTEIVDLLRRVENGQVIMPNWVTYHAIIREMAREVKVDKQVTIRKVDKQVERSELFKLLRDGKKIQAVKMVRDRTGLGLYESKNIVDAVEIEMRTGKVVKSPRYHSPATKVRLRLRNRPAPPKKNRK